MVIMEFMSRVIDKLQQWDSRRGGGGDLDEVMKTALGT